MNFKTTYVLFGILGVVLLVFAWVLWVGPTNVEQTAFVLPSMHKEGSPLDPKDITRVEIERSSPSAEKFVFVRDAGGDPWRIVEPRDYAANSSAIDNLVRQVYNARLEEKSDVVNNPKQYGLETPVEVVTLIKEAEPRREVKLNVGEASPGKDKAVIYVTSSDRSEVMAVRKNDLDSVKKTAGRIPQPRPAQPGDRRHPGVRAQPAQQGQGGQGTDRSEEGQRGTLDLRAAALRRCPGGGSRPGRGG